MWSEGDHKFYIGHTSDLAGRLKRHNSGWEKSTQHGLPWQLLWSTTKKSKGEAAILEKKLKNLSASRLREFINKYNEGVAGH